LKMHAMRRGGECWSSKPNARRRVKCS